MRLLHFAALLPVLSLAACYGSEQNLYSISDGAMPLPAGDYSSANDHWDVRITEGHYAVPASISGLADVVLVPLPGRDRTYIIEKAEQGGFSYSLLKVLPGARSFALLRSDCAQKADRDAAQGLATMTETRCTFENPRSLTNAMSRLADAHLPDRWTTYSLK